MRAVSWISFAMDVNAVGFSFFYFDLEFWKRVHGSEPLNTVQKCLQSPYSSEDGLYRILSSNWVAHFYLMKGRVV
jgi:hypothetical protein